MTVILYIEDNPQNMRLVRKMLKTGGYEMIEAIDGKTGLQKVHDEKPNLILVDINLPDIDGMEITARIKKDSSLQHIPVIALTANAMFGDRERFLEGGCDGYLAKPISRRELLSTVEQFLDSKNGSGK
jgi:two-component system cell cycle response regulator DivK